MASVLCDVTLWLEHAKAVRALSEIVSDPKEKEQMLVVAAGFDRIAKLAGEQVALQELYHYSTDRPARARRSQTRRVRKNAAWKAPRTRPFRARSKERLSLLSQVGKQSFGRIS